MEYERALLDDWPRISFRELAEEMEGEFLSLLENLAQSLRSLFDR